MADKVHVKGLAELERKLAQLEPNVRKNVLRAALRAAGAVVGRQARANARRSWPQASRLGRSSGIVWRVSRIRGSTARVKISWTTDPSRSKDKTSAPWYAHFLEFGTRFISARPFLRPAFFSKQDEALDVFRKKLGEGIDKQFSRLR